MARRAIVKWDELIGSGFARWHALSVRGDAPRADGRRVLTLAARGQRDIAIDVVVAADGTVLRVDARVPDRPERSTVAPDAMAIDLVASLVQVLAPHDAPAGAFVARLRAHIGLGPVPACAVPVPDRDVVIAAAAAFLGSGTGGAVRLTLDDGATLTVGDTDGALHVRWCAPEPHPHFSG